MSDWFEELLGFSERTPDEVRVKLQLDETRVRSKINGESYECGRLEVVSLQELRERVAAAVQSDGKLQVAELVGDARAMHMDVANAGALFQVASQFNLLEMVSPSVIPEHGIGIYENDPTQGPACAIACGAGTIYRNYFVELDGQIGQTASKQVDCLADIGGALGNVPPHPQPLSPQEPAAQEGRGEQRKRSCLWEMKNGYALPTTEGLKEVDSILGSMSEVDLEGLRSKLKIGVQWDTQVTLGGCAHLVTQAYCSALPVAYSALTARLWERFAKLILEAAYEATFAAAVLNASKTGNNLVYLTLLGGGAFGNDQVWILDAIRRVCRLFQHSDLAVKIVSYKNANPSIRQMCASL